MHSINNLKLRGFGVELHWVPAHVGVDGNEAAYKSAKEATGWRLKSLRPGKTREENTSSTATKAQLVKVNIGKENSVGSSCTGRMELKWTVETRGRALYKLEPSPRRGIVKLHLGLTKELSALVVQMRTEKIGLREFLFHRKVPGIGNGRCICRQGKQTVKHVLLDCRLYNQMRRGLWTEESKKARKEGGRCLDLERILTDGPCAKRAAIFKKETG